VKPVLRGSFDIYTGEETEDHPSIPLLSHVEPSMSELYLGAIVRVVALFMVLQLDADVLCRKLLLQDDLNQSEMDAVEIRYCSDACC
jgi:hypothetical protein